NLGSSKEEILEDAKKAGIMYDQNLDADIRSVRETIKYGLKGIAAYAHQARFVKYNNDEVDEFYFKALASLADNSLTLEDLIKLLVEAGSISVKIMELLDTANNTIYNSPSPTKVNVNTKKGPFIIVSGHDLKDLEMLLKQTEGKGINIYTHGEMLPSHGYPELNKYPHLVGNFGGAWQNQQKEFDNIPGCILMTTNCLMKPRDSYKDRIFSTSVVGWDGIKHISKDENGNKDFTEIINKALELGGFEKDEEVKEILVGFGHKATLSHADTIINAVKDGKVKHFFLIGGCDGAKPGRNYYTEFAEKVPKDCIILTLACGKYRFNKLEFGEVAGLPRLLDVGQCNDAYSAVRIALALADAFKCGVNDLPLSIVLSWYEQKAVADLLALLSLGVKGIYIGPSLPAFLSPNVLQFLVDNFDIKPISTPDDDLKQILS
ncbi:MAG TPA: hydroxylamine reductase, partial [Clostridium sp.]